MVSPLGASFLLNWTRNSAATILLSCAFTTPKLKRATWMYPDLETEKKVTGWEKNNTVQIVFESALRMELELTVSVNREGTFHPLVKPFVSKRII